MGDNIKYYNILDSIGTISTSLLLLKQYCRGVSFLLSQNIKHNDISDQYS